jgi:hypothetical protein
MTLPLFDVTRGEPWLSLTTDDDPAATDRCLSDCSCHFEIDRVAPAVRVELTQLRLAGPRDFQQLGPQLRSISGRQPKRSSEDAGFVSPPRAVRIQAVVRQLSHVDDCSPSIR